jgi:Protein of unknown function (DUF4013)
MTEAMATTPLRSVFQFPFRGSNWLSRFAIGCALILAASFIPIIPMIFVCGYVLQVMRQAIDGQDLALPEWENWGKLGIDGLRATVVGLVYLLPGMLVMIGGMALYFVGVMAFTTASAAAEQAGETMGAVAGLGLMAAMAVFFLSLAAGPVLLLVGAVPLPAALANMVAHDKTQAAFHLRQLWPFVRANKLGYFIDWVIIAGLIYIMSLVMMVAYYSIVLCCFIPILVAPVSLYLSLVGAALFGQTYRESTAMLSAGDHTAPAAT